MNETFREIIDGTLVSIDFGREDISVVLKGLHSSTRGRELYEAIHSMASALGIFWSAYYTEVVDIGDHTSLKIYCPKNMDATVDKVESILSRLQSKVNDDGKYWGDALQEIEVSVQRSVCALQSATKTSPKRLSGKAALAALTEWVSETPLPVETASGIKGFIASRLITDVSLPTNILAPFVAAAVADANISEQQRAIAERSIMDMLKKKAEASTEKARSSWFRG